MMQTLDNKDTSTSLSVRFSVKLTFLSRLMSGFCKYQLPGKDEFKNLNVIILYNFNQI